MVELLNKEKKLDCVNTSTFSCWWGQNNLLLLFLWRKKTWCLCYCFCVWCLSYPPSDLGERCQDSLLLFLSRKTWWLCEYLHLLSKNNLAAVFMKKKNLMFVCLLVFVFDVCLPPYPSCDLGEICQDILLLFLRKKTWWLCEYLNLRLLVKSRILGCCFCWRHNAGEVMITDLNEAKKLECEWLC